MTKRLFTYFTLLSILVLFTVRCATIASPSGGPRDSLPPLLVGAGPAPYSVNYNGKKVILVFNEYVQLKDQSKLFFMSPQAGKKPTLSIKGKSVVVEFEEPLDSNSTYRLDFGASIVDNNEGNKLNDFSFVFSTGPVIDSLVMSGQTIDAFSRDTVIGAYVFYFNAKADSLKLDSTMYRSRAEALFRSDSSGYMVADILKDRPYRIYALADENGNQLYEAGTDKIAFLDSTYNPTQMDEFSMAYDSIKRRWELNPPQIMLELFKEEPPKRQLLLEQKRLSKQLMHFVFNAPNAIIDTLKFDNIPEDWVKKRWNKTQDTLSMWLVAPSKEELDAVADSITGRLAYQRHDSLWNYYTHGQNLALYFKSKAFKAPEKILSAKDSLKIRQLEIKDSIRLAKKEERRKKSKRYDPVQDSIRIEKLRKADSLKNQKAIADSIEKAKQDNPFSVKVNAAKEFIPLSDMFFDFEYPIIAPDISKITLKQKSAQVRKGGGRQQSQKNEYKPIKFAFFNDTLIETRWRLRADWKIDDSYELLIPKGVLNNIAFQSNDTLNAEFTVASPDKFGTLDIKLRPDSTLTSHPQYILQVIEPGSKEAKIVREIIVAPTNISEIIQIQYLRAGNYRLRIIEDTNANARWDTGSLTERRHPERVRIWRAESGSPQIVSKENWQVELDVDLYELFKNQ